MICSASSGTSPFEIEWYKNGHKLVNFKSLRIDTLNEYSVLLIDPLVLDDNGNYTCTMSNNHGSDSYTVSLIVECKHSSRIYTLLI